MEQEIPLCQLHQDVFFFILFPFLNYIELIMLKNTCKFMRLTIGAYLLVRKKSHEFEDLMLKVFPRKVSICRIPHFMIEASALINHAIDIHQPLEKKKKIDEHINNIMILLYGDKNVDEFYKDIYRGRVKIFIDDEKMLGALIFLILIGDIIMFQSLLNYIVKRGGLKIDFCGSKTTILQKHDDWLWERTIKWSESVFFEDFFLRRNLTVDDQDFFMESGFDPKFIKRIRTEK